MPHDFDSLKQWAELDDAQLEEIATEERIALLQRAVHLLADESTPAPAVNRNSFPAIVRQMWKLYREGSWQLGEAIIKASDLADRAEYAEASAVYERFLSVCKSRFYQDIARIQLKRIAEKPSS
jgi:hypothetical protein